MSTTELADLQLVTVTTRRGIATDVMVGGPEDGMPVVFLHGFTGQLGGEPALQELATRGFRVHAPLWPGYSDHSGEESIDDMLDFALHGADVITALGLDSVHLIGHSMGGMIAAEMAALSPASYRSLTLIDPLGLWLDENPIIDIYTLLPFEFPPLLFHDDALGTTLLAGGGVDFADPGAIQRFLIANSRRLGTAGKILFPIPNRRLSKRLYRVTTPTLLMWGDDDRLVTTPYVDAWASAIPHSSSVIVPAAGHMAPYEQPLAVADAFMTFATADSDAT
ncbi:MAG: alpha/beta hydrolase fold [Ilumatobacteraceae bacterium]|nr:alpha/beta hydrolase fold [Ilumatobacteraceae bacterium]